MVMALQARMLKTDVKIAGRLARVELGYFSPIK